VSSISRSNLCILIIALLVILIVVYKFFDPLAYDFFPKCPFLVLTGYQCAGCGSQRAIHELLNLNFSGAWQHNALFIISLPYIFIGLVYKLVSEPTPRILYWRKVLFGQRAIIVVMIMIVCFWVGRNVIGR